MRNAARFISLTLLLAGCSGSSNGTPPPAPDGGVAPDAPAVQEDAGGACERDSDGRCVVFDWTDASAFPMPIDHHVALIHESSAGAFLWVLGGMDMGAGTIYQATLRSRLGDDGTPGAWEAGPMLPEPRAFHTLAVTDDRVYLLAGRDLPGALTATWVADLRDDGSLSEWRTTQPIPDGRVHASAHAYGGRIYVIGGTQAGNTASAVVFSAPIEEDGALGFWREEIELLPRGRSHHTSVLHDGSIYVIGGFSGELLEGVEENEILRGHIADDGTVEAWQTVGTIPEAPWTASAFERDGYVYVLGGGQGSNALARYLARVRRAPFLSDGSIGEWEDVGGDLPQARAHVHHTPVWGSLLYSIGGRLMSETSLTDVVVGRMR